MKVTIKNIGKIKEAEIDLDKQLTVFFGPNNTGKTYISYCIYGLFDHTFILEFLNKGFKFEIDETVIKEKKVELNFDKDILPQRERVLKSFIEIKQKYFKSEFGNYLIKFNDSEFYPSFLKDDISFKHHFEKIKDVNLGQGVSVKKQNNLITVSTFGGGEDLDKEIIEKRISSNLNAFLNSWLFQTIILYHTISHFITAERIGISLFGKELGAKRLEQANIPQNRDEIISYPKAINDGLINTIKFRPVSFSIYSMISDFIENDILKGKLILDESGDVYFSDDEIKNLPLLNTASTIKSLSSLVLYLRYYCMKGDTLIIDEPEINLHPENQVKVARVLAKLSNIGVKVIVSTHSDYIIREFNNLIMLGSSDKNGKELMDKFGYFEEEILCYKNIGVYNFDDGHSKSVKITNEGFDTDSIDEVINSQNKASNEIRFKLIEN